MVYLANPAALESFVQNRTKPLWFYKLWISCYYFLETALHPLAPCNLLLALYEIQGIRIHAFSFRYQKEGGNGTSNVACKEDPKHIWYADFSAQVVEQHAGENGTEFAGGGTDSVGETAYTRRIEFSGDDESGGVGTEVEEQLETSNQHWCSYSFQE